jgi:hypothetical protein
MLRSTPIRLLLLLMSGLPAAARAQSSCELPTAVTRSNQLSASLRYVTDTARVEVLSTGGAPFATGVQQFVTEWRRQQRLRDAVDAVRDDRRWYCELLDRIEAATVSNDVASLVQSDRLARKRVEGRMWQVDQGERRSRSARSLNRAGRAIGLVGELLGQPTKSDSVEREAAVLAFEAERLGESRSVMLAATEVLDLVRQEFAAEWAGGERSLEVSSKSALDAFLASRPQSAREALERMMRAAETKDGVSVCNELPYYFLYRGAEDNAKCISEWFVRGDNSRQPWRQACQLDHDSWSIVSEEVKQRDYKGWDPQEKRSREGKLPLHVFTVRLRLADLDGEAKILILPPNWTGQFYRFYRFDGDKFPDRICNRSIDLGRTKLPSRP